MKKAIEPAGKRNGGAVAEEGQEVAAAGAVEEGLITTLMRGLRGRGIGGGGGGRWGGTGSKEECKGKEEDD